MKSLGKAAKVSKAELALNLRMQARDHKVAKANKRFEKADPAAKRVLIAKDVLTWLDIGKLKPAPGVYIRSKYAYDPETGDAWAFANDAPYSIQERVVKVEGSRIVDDKVSGGTCAACALGGLFACAVERADGVKELFDSRHTNDVRDFWNASQDHMHTYLRPYFELEQLLLIESAFERSDFVKDGLWNAWIASGKEDDPSRELRDEWQARGMAAAAKFPHITNASDRMRAIMQNIIDNGGTFVV